jgi:Ca-activated chloride channel family protein
MNSALFGIHWASWNYWWIFLVITLIIICFVYRQTKVRRAIQAISGRWQSLVIHNFLPYRQYLKALFFGSALCLSGLAILRPQWHEQEKIIMQEGRDVLIALDISRSMLATDCVPNRLEIAKKKIRQLLSMLQCERVGLILFSGSAFMQCPLTTDYSAFHMFLDQVDVETISSGSTALDAAIEQALGTFCLVPEHKSKLLVIFTDGEDFSSNLSELKQKAHKQSMRIFTMGIGTVEGAPIPLYDQNGEQIGHQKDSRDKIVISQLNEGILSSLAHDVGGMYISMTHDKSDLKILRSYIERFEKDHFESKQLKQFDDKYHYFLLLGLICLIIEWLL